MEEVEALEEGVVEDMATVKEEEEGMAIDRVVDMAVEEVAVEDMEGAVEDTEQAEALGMCQSTSSHPILMLADKDILYGSSFMVDYLVYSFFRLA